MQKTCKMIETLAYGYSSDRSRWEHSDEYQQDRVEGKQEEDLMSEEDGRDVTKLTKLNNLANTKLCKQTCKMIETLAYGYSSDRSRRELSDEYQQDRVSMEGLSGSRRKIWWVRKMGEMWPNLPSSIIWPTQNYANKPVKWLKPWHMATHLIDLGESFPMNTNKTGFRWNGWVEAGGRFDERGRCDETSQVQ